MTCSVAFVLAGVKCSLLYVLFFNFTFMCICLCASSMISVMIIIIIINSKTER